MAAENFSGPIPLVVGVLPDQHVEVLQTARTLAERLGVPLVCAYVDEASYLVEWDPSREAHRMSLHPEKDDVDVEAVRDDLGKVIAEAMDGGTAEWTLRLLAGDPARALGRLASDINASMIIVGTPEPGLGHRISEALNGSVAAWLSHHQRRPVLIVPQKKRPEAAHRN
ncbi:universal stress protein [Arthrobacter sp. R3-55]